FEPPPHLGLPAAHGSPPACCTARSRYSRSGPPRLASMGGSAGAVAGRTRSGPSPEPLGDSVAATGARVLDERGGAGTLYPKSTVQPRNRATRAPGAGSTA